MKNSLLIVIMLFILGMSQNSLAAVLTFRSGYQSLVQDSLSKLQQVDVSTKDIQRLLQVSEGRSTGLQGLLEFEVLEVRKKGEALISVLNYIEYLETFSAGDILLSHTFLIDKINQFQEEPTADNYLQISKELRVLFAFLPRSLDLSSMNIVSNIPGIEMTGMDAARERNDFINGYRLFIGNERKSGQFSVVHDNLITADFFTQKEAVLLRTINYALHNLDQQSAEVKGRYRDRIGVAQGGGASASKNKTSPLAIYFYAAKKSQDALFSALEAKVNVIKLGGTFDVSFIRERVATETEKYKRIVDDHNIIPQFGKVGFVTLPEVYGRLDENFVNYVSDDFQNTLAAILYYTEKGVMISDVQRNLQPVSSAIVAWNLFGTIAAYPNEFGKLRALVSTLSIYQLATGNKLSEIISRAMYPGALKDVVEITFANENLPLVASARIELARALKAPPEALEGFLTRFRAFKEHNVAPEFGFR